MFYHHGESTFLNRELRAAYETKPVENFSKFFDCDAYESLSIKFSIKRSLRKRDYVRNINVEIINNYNLDISIDELKSLVQLKFNNIFVNICKFENIVVKNYRMHNGIITKLNFNVNFVHPVNQYCLKQFVSKPLSELSINFIDLDRVMNFGLFFRRPKRNTC